MLYALRYLNRLKTNKKAFYQKGNFAPTHVETEYEIKDIVNGNVPNDIRGAFVKNGANIQFDSDLGRSHWFEADGMLHAFSIKNSKLFYCNRYVETPR